MAIKKARQRISYVLENARATEGGHRLGVNGLAVDNDNDILYSGGRDGIICAWDLDVHGKANGSEKKQSSFTKFRTQTLAHTNWINDITLAKNKTVVVSASSDLSVKLWRPHSEENNTRAVEIGEHDDYVKCVAPPPDDMGENWIASGGLDRKIRLWDLNGGGKTLEIDVKGDEVTEKGSVYALTVGRNILAAGGPEKTVKLYDPRTGSQISKLVGHLDNIRAILIDDAGDTVLSASADKTIKLWSIKGGRCMYTFTMHDESIWSLYSNDPRLGIFYSSDRSGVVAKTDVRGSLEDMDDGLSIAVVHEHVGVNRIVAAKGSIWTATSQSSINRWADINTGSGIQLPEPFSRQRAASTASNRSREQSLPQYSPAEKQKEIPAQAILRISNTAVFPIRATNEPLSGSNDNLPRKSSLAETHPDPEIRPVHDLPVETIEGQFGLLKHKLLNDRKRVLTLDTAGDVLLWDLIKCKPIQSFGKQHLEDVEVQVNTQEAVAPWCSVDLSSGNLTVVLDSFNCFDAEVYVDEMDLGEGLDYREDQRINLGKWILRYLFANLIDEEIRRDESHRQTLNESVNKRKVVGRANAPTSIVIPQSNLTQWESAGGRTPKAGDQPAPTTPGMGINMATPGVVPPVPPLPEVALGSPLLGLERNKTNASRQSTDQPDYFASGIAAVDGAKPAPLTPTTEPVDTKTEDEEKEKKEDGAKSPTTAFKKFRMPFGSKKSKRSASQPTQDKPVVAQDKTEGSESSSNYDKEVDDNLHGVVQKIRQDYDKQRADSPDTYVETLVTPTLPPETPVLKLPSGTKIFIQEETSGGNTNLYQGTVETVGRDVDIIEQKAPMWLGSMLLQNQIPFKEAVKISFILNPIDDLPSIAIVDGNNRLNANRMLRVKKILAYVAERIEVQEENPQPEGALRPEDYLDLYVYDKKISPNMSLATLRTHVWKGGSDIVMQYKANGNKKLNCVPNVAPPETQQAEEPAPPPAAA